MGFPQVLPEERRFLSSEAIHPLKQKSVECLVNLARKHPAVEYIIIFGSTLTWRCGSFSDIDVVVGDPTHTFVVPGFIPEGGDGSYEVFDRIYVDDLTPDWPLYDEVVENGVYVYVRKWELAGYRQTPPPEYSCPPS